MPFGLSKKKQKTAIDSQAPDGDGQITLPNPGEYPPDGAEQNMPRNSLGAIPPQGYRAGGNPHKPGEPGFLDDGARVGYLRNLEFSAGGRSQLVATGTSSPNRPHTSSETGQVQVSTATENDGSAGTIGQVPAIGGANPHAGDPPAQSESTLTSDENLDSNGSAGPERRVDRRGV